LKGKTKEVENTTGKKGEKKNPQLKDRKGVGARSRQRNGLDTVKVRKKRGREKGTRHATRPETRGKGKGEQKTELGNRDAAWGTG